MKITPIKIAISIVLGVLFPSVFGKIFILYALIAALILSIIRSIVIRRIDVSFILLAIAFTMSSLSYIYCVSQTHHPSIGFIDSEVTVSGEITSPAQENAYSDNFKYRLRLTSISNEIHKAKSSETILVTSPQLIPCGATVSLSGKMKSFPSQMNENGFDTEKYYKSCNIFSKMYSEDISVISTDTPSIYSLGGRISEYIDNIIYKHYSGDNAAILSALLTGNKHHFSAEYGDILSATSFERFFHPAYLHIWLILALVGLTKHFIPRKIREICIILIFLGYAMIQSGGIGFSRCLICAAFAILYRLRYGSAYYPDTMGTVVSLAVLFMPTIIYNVGFILSVIGGMLVWAFAPPLTAKLRKLPRFLRRGVAVIIVCVFLYTPFSLIYFNGLCIYSFFIPLIVAPLIIGVLITGPMTLILLELLGVAPIVSWMTNLVINVFYKLPYFIERLPFSHINIPTPSILEICALVSGIFLLYYTIKKRKKQVIVFSTVLSGIILTLSVCAISKIGTAEFIFVNVDHGDGAVIHTPYRETIVIDGGGGNSWSSYNPGKLYFVPYIESKGYNHIDTAVVSHYHQDHIEGIINILDSVKVDRIIAPAICDFYSDSMIEWAQNLKASAIENGTEIYYISEDTRFEFDSGLVLDVYKSDTTLGIENENDTTIPVKATYGDFSVLYTGDLSAEAEKELLNRVNVDSDVLKVSHHGSRNSSCEEFISAVSPKISVISCGTDNVYGHPHKETLERVKDSTILRTDLMKDINITVRKDGSYKVKR